MNELDIISAWARIRKIDNTIPDEVLDFMKESAIEKLRHNQSDLVTKSISFEVIKNGLDAIINQYVSFVKLLGEQPKIMKPDTQKTTPNNSELAQYPKSKKPKCDKSPDGEHHYVMPRDSFELPYCKHCYKEN